jgi:hypothetical protein
VRHATVRTSLADAERVAAAVRPDNTAEMTTRAEGGTVVTTIERETTGGLRATLDDYLANLGVAEVTGAHADRHHDTTHDTP